MALKNEIGVIGMAVMGANLARNLANNGFRTAIYNRTVQTTANFLAEFGNDHLSGSERLEDFVNGLELPRKIILMVRAGQAIDDLIDQLLPFLTKGDILVDGGNSLWKDTVRREQDLQKVGIYFFGCGVSGGEEGALHGPSLMPGGEKEVYEKQLAPIFEKIAAHDFSGKPCVTWVAQNGAGHFIKMVHNGIEYGLMQILAEIYDILRKLYGLKSYEIANIFQELNAGELESFLMEISAKVLRKKDDLTGEYLIEKILDQSGQKNTGLWTVLEALERGIAIPSITEAVNARLISHQKVLRTILYQGVVPRHLTPEMTLSEFTKLLKNALLAAFLSVYAQGFALISEAARQQNWPIDLPEITRIWQGGCIIRARMLEFLEDALRTAPEKDVHLFTLLPVNERIDTFFPSLRKILAIGIQGGIPLPVLSSALAYGDGLRQADGNANLIQALRDFFGAHTFERNDLEGVFHANWEE